VGAAALEKKMGLGLGFFFVFFTDVVKIAPSSCLAENEGYL